MNTDKIVNGLKQSISSKNNLPYELKVAKNVYTKFVEKISKTDFANSPRRYIVELEQLKNLKEIAQKYSIAEEADKVQEGINAITEKLKNDFGITFTK